MSAAPALRATASPEIAGSLSTVRKISERLRAIEQKRLVLGLTRAELAALADVSERTLRYGLLGSSIRVSTLRKLERALGAYRPEPAPSPEMARAVYRALLVALAWELGLDPDDVLSADPRRERGGVARCRMRAFYLMVTEFDLTMTAAARLAGITKQAISKSMKSIEDERDEPKLDAMLARVARQVGGKSG